MNHLKIAMDALRLLQARIKPYLGQPPRVRLEVAGNDLLVSVHWRGEDPDVAELHLYEPVPALKLQTLQTSIMDSLAEKFNAAVEDRES